MSIDFSTLAALTVPEGVVVKIEDTDGNVLWERSDNAIVLEVEKITSNTYANSTTYSSEEFILLNIYPKTNGTVNITYGGLTKTITDTSGAEEPDAQQVFFGTFNGVSDEVETPASGTLTIEGDYRGVGVGEYNASKSAVAYYGGITAISSLGNAEIIPAYAFYKCTGLTSVTIPEGVTYIGNHAFDGCTGLTSVTIPSSVTDTGAQTFYGCTGLVNIAVDSDNKTFSADGGILFSKNQTVLYAYPAVSGHYTIPESVNSIGASAFRGCTSLTSVTIPEGVTYIASGAFYGCTNLTSVTIPSSVGTIGNEAFYLKSGYTRMVTMLSDSPAALGYYVFDVAGTNNIVVPAGSGDTYKTADEYWSEYADYITEASA